MSRLKLALLGEPVVRHGGRRIKFRTHKSMALLSFLAVQGGIHSRELLATMLWPKAEPRTGRKRLRNALYYLRRPLQQQHASGSEGSHLLTDRDHIGFDFTSNYHLDVEQMLEINPQGRLAELKAAAELYRGNFLKGFSPGDTPEFDTWIARKRQQLELKACGVLDQLSSRLEQRGELQPALQAALRWSEIKPLDERAYVRRIQLHLRTGNRAAAYSVYQKCRQRLREELDLEPSPETQAIAEAIGI